MGYNWILFTKEIWVMISLYIRGSQTQRNLINVSKQGTAHLLFLQEKHSSFCFGSICSGSLIACVPQIVSRILLKKYSFYYFWHSSHLSYWQNRKDMTNVFPLYFHRSYFSFRDLFNIIKLFYSISFPPAVLLSWSTRYWLFFLLLKYRVRSLLKISAF